MSADPDPRDFAQELATFVHEGEHVIEAADLYSSRALPSLFVNYTKQPRKAVRLRLVEGQDYLVARHDRKVDRWIPCDSTVSQGKPLVKLAYVMARLHGKNSTDVTTVAPHEDENEEHEEQPIPSVVPLQPILELEDHELLQDEQGRPFPMTCRGERHPKKSFFKVSDVGKALDVDLCKAVTKPTSSYLLGEDYVRMALDPHAALDLPSSAGRPPPKLGGGGSCPEGESASVELYFTYRGWLRCLFTSRKAIARVFVAWAEEVLFAAHMGTYEQRNELAAAIVGIKADIVRQFAGHVYTFKMAGIYLMYLGTVGDLRNAMGLEAETDDSLLVLKWGRTEDLDRRTRELDSQYGKLDGADMRLMYFAPIDPRFQSVAEVDAKETMCRMGQHLTCVRMKHEAKKELVLLSEQVMRQAAKEAFGRIAAQYAGCLKDMMEEVERQRDLGQQKDLRLEDKDMQLEDKSRQLENKDKQLEELKASHKHQLEDKDRQHDKVVGVLERMVDMLKALS